MSYRLQRVFQTGQSVRLTPLAPAFGLCRHKEEFAIVFRNVERGEPTVVCVRYTVRRLREPAPSEGEGLEAWIKNLDFPYTRQRCNCLLAPAANFPAT